jgi:pimeloyl-ACP methyl ester carboxylesterase
MWPLQDPLSAQYRTVSVDWPGFGDKAPPSVGWKPAAYAASLQYILDTVAPRMQ